MLGAIASERLYANTLYLRIVNSLKSIVVTSIRAHWGKQRFPYYNFGFSRARNVFLHHRLGWIVWFWTIAISYF